MDNGKKKLPKYRQRERTKRIRNIKYSIQPTYNGCSTLFSYAYLAEMSPNKAIDYLERNREYSNFVILDSGVFTMRRLGLELDVERYGIFAREVAKRGLVDVVVNMDHGSHWEMRKNFGIIRNYVKDHAYVMWVHQPIHGFDSLRRIAKEFPYIGLGTFGLDNGISAILRTPEIHSYYKTCSKILKDYGATFHGFAMTAGDILLDPDIDWGTVDSSSWLAGRRWGFQMITCKDTGKKIRIPQPYSNTSRQTDGGATLSTVPVGTAISMLGDYGIHLKDYQKFNGNEMTSLGAVSAYNLEQFAWNKRKNNPDICKRLQDIGLYSFAETKKPFRLVLVIGTEECRIAIKVAQQARTKQMMEWRRKQANEKALHKLEKIRFKKNVKKIKSLESIFQDKKNKKTKKRR
ncbi:MAG: hypothetical protein ACR2M6_02490 [Vampirovibrionia bacterium]